MNICCISSQICCSTISSHSSSTRSHLFKTTRMFSTPRRRKIARCSLVCGIIPSSAAITRRTRSIPTTPAVILEINFSCPGTSMIPTRSPSVKSIHVNPRSIVIPRAFSSFRRSVSLPVNALISVVLP